MSNRVDWSQEEVDEALYETATTVVRDAVDAYNSGCDTRYVSSNHDSPEEAIRADAEVYGVDIPPLALIEYTPDVNVSDVPLGRLSSRDEVLRTVAAKSGAVAVRERALEIFEDEYTYDEQDDTYQRDPTAQL